MRIKDSVPFVDESAPKNFLPSTILPIHWIGRLIFQPMYILIFF